MDIHSKQIKIFLLVLVGVLVIAIGAYAYLLNKEMKKETLSLPENISAPATETEAQKKELDTLREKNAISQKEAGVMEEQKKQLDDLRLQQQTGSLPTQEQIDAQKKELEDLRNANK